MFQGYSKLLTSEHNKELTTLVKRKYEISKDMKMHLAIL